MEQQLIKDITRIFNPDKKLNDYNEVIKFLELVEEVDLKYFKALKKINRIIDIIYSD